jgi:hypothetical protein
MAPELCKKQIKRNDQRNSINNSKSLIKMKKFDNFDESVKNKMDGMNFPFNEANWEKMSQILDTTRPAKKPFGKLPLISSIIVGSALIIGSVWYMMNDSSPAKEVAQHTNTSVTANAEANVISDNTMFLNSNNSDNSNTNSTISSNEKTVLTINSTNVNSSSSITEREELSGKNEKNTSVNANSEKNTVAKRTDNTVAVNSFAGNSQNSEAIAANENEAENSNSNIQLPVGAKEGERMKGDVNANKSSTSGTIKPDLGKVAEQLANQQAANETNNNASVNPEENDLIALPTVTTNLGQTAETIAAANLVTSALEEKKAWEYVRVKHHTMTLEGGASNSFGWAVNKTRNGNNISPVLGINYMYNIDSRSSLLIGLQYNSIANLGEAKANFSVTSYGFGMNNDVTTYKLNDLHYAVMPAKYIYRINKNNALGFGANMMYLMNTRTQIINTKVTESNVAPTSESRYEFGYGFDQLNKFNAQLALSYHHSISNKLAINVELNKAVMNVVKDYKYFGAKNTNSAPAAIKLSLTYTLFNK